MNLNEKIFTLRKRFGYSQEELAYKVGVSRQTVSKWETDYMKPETEKIILMSKLFNVTTDVLLIDEIDISIIVDTKNATANNESDQVKSNIKSKKTNLFRTGVIMSVVSFIGIIAIVLISLFSSAAGDVTMIYTTMYISLKTIFYILIVLLIVGLGLVVYKLIRRIKKKEKGRK